MFCNQCGKQLAENSVFCSYCGGKVVGSDDNSGQVEERDDHPLFQFKPKFYGAYVAKKLIPFFVFFSIFISFIISFIRGTISFFNEEFGASPSNQFGYQLPSEYSEPVNQSPVDQFIQMENFVIGALIAFLLIIVLGYSVNKKRYQRSEFLFYRDRMEYIDGYFNFNKKQIYYKNIHELSMNQNIFQRKYGIGSIRLTTSGVTYRNNRAYSNGIVVFDIPDIDANYQKLKKIVK